MVVIEAFYCCNFELQQCTLGHTQVNSICPINNYYPEHVYYAWEGYGMQSSYLFVCLIFSSRQLLFHLFFWMKLLVVTCMAVEAALCNLQYFAIVFGMYLVSHIHILTPFVNMADKNKKAYFSHAYLFYCFRSRLSICRAVSFCYG